ncbi:hypothetical protein IMZ08_03955 [Bacillus luteolus]|uniref:Uncharacterized protein n=1 Tax=Litchfieldia luteola TaxID=682179 RepID=A0ABR9QFE4_9BACI|nr:hypothetical protein [Cytobacillus luteolus]MBE4907212.1 hypothetical protein [Cytobacillus luteolus]MBP1943312.1 asparagine N-glycosylation enzyme membrane subunit Stt3 [Cytobacillus luteolus]
MAYYIKIGVMLVFVYAVVLGFLFATAEEMEIFLALNFGLIGFVVLIGYFVVGFLYVRVVGIRRIILVILGILIVYGLYFVLINLSNNTGAPKLF